MPERPQTEKTLIAAIGDALDGNDGVFVSMAALVEMIVGIPTNYRSLSESASYFCDRTVEILDQAQLGLMLADVAAVERLAPAQREELDRSRAEAPGVTAWDSEPRLLMLSHRRSGTFVHVKGNVGVVPIHFGPVRWLLGLRSIGALTWTVLPDLMEPQEPREAY